MLKSINDKSYGGNFRMSSDSSPQGTNGFVKALFLPQDNSTVGLPDFNMTPSNMKQLESVNIISYNPTGADEMLFVSFHNRELKYRRYVKIPALGFLVMATPITYDQDLGADFQKFRLVSAVMKVVSNTVSTTNAPFAGTMNAVICQSLNPVNTLDFNNILPSAYSSSNKLMNVDSYEGLVALAPLIDEHEFKKIDDQWNYTLHEVVRSSKVYTAVTQVLVASTPIEVDNLTITPYMIPSYSRGHVRINLSLSFTSSAVVSHNLIIGVNLFGFQLSDTFVVQQSGATLQTSETTGAGSFRSIFLTGVFDIWPDLANFNVILNSSANATITYSGELAFEFFDMALNGQIFPATVVTLSGLAPAQKYNVTILANTEVVPNFNLAKELPTRFNSDSRMGDLLQAKDLIQLLDKHGYGFLYTCGGYERAITNMPPNLFERNQLQMLSSGSVITDLWKSFKPHMGTIGRGLGGGLGSFFGNTAMGMKVGGSIGDYISNSSGSGPFQVVVPQIKDKISFEVDEIDDDSDLESVFVDIDDRDFEMRSSGRLPTKAPKHPNFVRNVSDLPYYVKSKPKPKPILEKETPPPKAYYSSYQIDEPYMESSGKTPIDMAEEKLMKYITETDTDKLNPSIVDVLTKAIEVLKLKKQTSLPKNEGKEEDDSFVGTLFLAKNQGPHYSDSVDINLRLNSVNGGAVKTWIDHCRKQNDFLYGKATFPTIMSTGTVLTQIFVTDTKIDKLETGKLVTYNVVEIVNLQNQKVSVHLDTLFSPEDLQYVSGILARSSAFNIFKQVFIFCPINPGTSGKKNAGLSWLGALCVASSLLPSRAAFSGCPGLVKDVGVVDGLVSKTEAAVKANKMLYFFNPQPDELVKLSDKLNSQDFDMRPLNTLFSFVKATNRAVGAYVIDQPDIVDMLAYSTCVTPHLYEIILTGGEKRTGIAPSEAVQKNTQYSVEVQRNNTNPVQKANRSDGTILAIDFSTWTLSTLDDWFDDYESGVTALEDTGQVIRKPITDAFKARQFGPLIRKLALVEDKQKNLNAPSKKKKKKANPNILPVEPRQGRGKLQSLNWD